jgi:murein DD-endopeptidase MepM/ murein hydrolase activator NlpD
LHGGIDITLAEGTPLRAIGSGRVVALGTGGQAEGIYAWLQHAPRETGLSFWVYSKYQHLSAVPPHAVGEAVRVGQQVGLSGKTGTTGGHYGVNGYPHLHLTTFAGPSSRYDIRGSRVVAEQARIFDPLAIYIPNLDNLDEVESLPTDRKKVPIPYVAADGSIRPADSRLVWPVSCGSH